MATSPLRWGLLGTARINSALIPPLRMSPRSELVAVASRDAEKGQAYARKWQIPRVCEGYETMLADPAIDVVYISLPNTLHAEWTIRAVQAGKHVLCEKPIAISLEDVDAIQEAAQKAGVVVMEAFMYRHHAQTLKVKEMLDRGAIGELRLLRGTFSFKLTDARNIRLDPNLGGGSIWDVGSYPISYFRTMVGQEPSEVFGWQQTGPSGVDVLFAGQMRFPGGALGQFDSGFSVPPRTHMELVGSTGTITVARPFKPGLQEEILVSHGDDDDVQAIPVTAQELYLGEVENMADAILLGKQPRVSLADSRANVATILALLQSAREGKPISLKG